MRKSAFFLAMLLTTNFLLAQENTTSTPFVIGGTLNFSADKNFRSLPSTLGISTTNPDIGQFVDLNKSKSSYFAFTPYGGKHLNKHWVTGLLFDVRRSKFETTTMVLNDNPQDSFQQFSKLTINTKQYGFGIWGRYIFNPENKFKVFIQANASINFIEEYINLELGNNYTNKTTYVDFGLSAGAIYDISNNVRALLKVGGVSYVNGESKIDLIDSPTNFSSFKTNINPSSVSFGLEVGF